MIGSYGWAKTQRSNSVFDRGVSYLTNAIVDLASQSMNADPSIDHED